MEWNHAKEKVKNQPSAGKLMLTCNRLQTTKFKEQNTLVLHKMLLNNRI
jgi:hypothetical protein